jgi:hypothetical protein
MQHACAHIISKAARKATDLAPLPAQTLDKISSVKGVAEWTFFRELKL